MRTDPIQAPARVFTSPWLTTEEAETYAKVSVELLQIFRKNRKLGYGEPGPRCENPYGKIYRYHTADLDAWIRRDKSAAPQQPIALAAPLLEGANNAA